MIAAIVLVAIGPKKRGRACFPKQGLGGGPGGG